MVVNSCPLAHLHVRRTVPRGPGRVRTTRVAAPQGWLLATRLPPAVLRRVRTTGQGGRTLPGLPMIFT
jgi:hypothetical protein